MFLSSYIFTGFFQSFSHLPIIPFSLHKHAHQASHITLIRPAIMSTFSVPFAFLVFSATVPACTTLPLLHITLGLLRVAARLVFYPRLRTPGRRADIQLLPRTSALTFSLRFNLHFWGPVSASILAVGRQKFSRVSAWALTTRGLSIGPGVRLGALATLSGTTPPAAPLFSLYPGFQQHLSRVCRLRFWGRVGKDVSRGSASSLAVGRHGI